MRKAGDNISAVRTSRPPAGAVFRRCALQVNPSHCAKAFRGQDSGVSAQSYAEAIVGKAVEMGVSILAITDHNNAGGVSAFRDAAAPHGITIFPGFELSSSEGIHVLCIYPPDIRVEQLSRFLGTFGIVGLDPSADLSDKSFAEILVGVEGQGGVTVAAHVTGDNGLFKVLNGQARIHAWRSEQLLALQIPGPVGDLRLDVRRIIEGKDSNYRRDHNAGDRLAVAVINARDVAEPEDLAHPSATSWIKMSELSIEGLRQAFLDPESRIRLNSDAEPDKHAEILSLTWEGGFLDGVAIDFNPNLNVLVGGRGAGKSTIVESLRYALGLEPMGGESRSAHDGIVRQVLRSGTKISLRARSCRPVEREFIIERTVPNPPVIRDESGQVLSLLPEDILPHVEIFGQHEISELARSPEKLTLLLSRFSRRDESLDRRKSSVCRDLEQKRRSIIDVRSELGQIDERLDALPGLEETLDRYKEAGLEDRLRERSQIVREEGVLDSIHERVAPFRELLDALRQELPIDRVFLSPKALDGLPGKAIISNVDPVLEHLSDNLEQAANMLEAALERADRGVESVRSRWEERKSEVESEYRKILRELQRSAVDGEEFIRLREHIERLRPLRERRTLLRRLEGEHLTRRRELLTEWEDVKAEEFRRLDRASKTVSRKMRDRVQVKVTAAGNREPLFQLLRDAVGGRLSEGLAALDEAPQLALPEFVHICRQGPDAIQERYAIPRLQAERLARASPETLMKVEELDLPPTTEILLNTASDGESPRWQALDSLSTGQKATAVLLLLLLESDAPLIVDQPEDDLDNRFITEGVVPRVREEKRRRQFIFSTHNANIPVLGDAELILGLAASGEADVGSAAIRPEHIGSIDTPSVRELVEDLLEGGKTAFETRRLKYGF